MAGGARGGGTQRWQCSGPGVATHCAGLLRALLASRLPASPTVAQHTAPLYPLVVPSYHARCLVERAVSGRGCWQCEERTNAYLSVCLFVALGETEGMWGMAIQYVQGGGIVTWPLAPPALLRRPSLPIAARPLLGVSNQKKPGPLIGRNPAGRQEEFGRGRQV